MMKIKYKLRVKNICDILKLAVRAERVMDNLCNRMYVRR